MIKLTAGLSCNKTENNMIGMFRMLRKSNCQFRNVKLIKLSRTRAKGLAWLLMPIIQATQKVEIRGLQFEDSPGKRITV
jgi:hypothetical protein